MTTGRATGIYKVETNRDGADPVLMLQVEMTSEDDVQSVQLMKAAGVDYNPPADSIVFVTQSGDAWKIGIAVDDGVASDTLPGELELYSSAGGNKIGKIRISADGTVTVTTPAGELSVAADGTITGTTPGGGFSMDPAGLFDVNGNFTVLP